MKTHPSPVDLERTYWSTRGPGEPGERDAELHAHVSGCPECTLQWTEIAMLAGAGRQIEPAPAVWDRREDIRTTILSKVELAKPRPRFEWRLRWAAPLALAAAALAVWLAWPAAPSPPGAVAIAHRGVVLEHSTSRHLVVSSMPDEIVRLVDGTITVTIAPLGAGEKFRVITGDGEIDAAGAAFDVTARDDRMVSVRAIHGVVKLLAAGSPITLRAGEIWRSSTELASLPTPPIAATPPYAATASTPPAAPGIAGVAATRTPHDPAPATRTPIAAIDRTPSRAVNEARTSPTPRDPPPNEDAVAVEIADAGVPVVTPTVTPTVPRSMGQQAFDEGWSALRTGDFSAASKAFERALAVTIDPRITEDAAFWRGVALARAGDVGTAAHVFAAYLTAYPSSPRTAEASVMLGWLLFERGETAEAGRRFERGLRDPSSRVRDSAAAGQRAVAERRN